MKHHVKILKPWDSKVVFIGFTVLKTVLFDLVDAFCQSDLKLHHLVYANQLLTASGGPTAYIWTPHTCISKFLYVVVVVGELIELVSSFTIDYCRTINTETACHATIMNIANAHGQT
jgi:hypothetical protein